MHYVLAVMMTVAVDGLQCGRQTAKTLLTNEAQLVVCGPQVVDHGALVLPHFTAPGAVGHPIKVVECIWIMYVHQPHYLWGFRWGYHSEKL